MKKIKKEYYFITLLLICFVFLTFFVVGGKTNSLDENVFNGVIKMENSFITKFLYIITNLASTIGIIVLVILTGVIFLRKKALSDFK